MNPGGQFSMVKGTGRRTVGSGGTNATLYLILFDIGGSRIYFWGGGATSDADDLRWKHAKMRELGPVGEGARASSAPRIRHCLILHIITLYIYVYCRGVAILYITMCTRQF